MVAILRTAQPSCIILVVLACCCVCRCDAAHPFAPRAPYRLATVRANGLAEGPDLVSRCTEMWHNTTLDHYTWVRLKTVPTRARLHGSGQDHELISLHQILPALGSAGHRQGTALRKSSM